MTLTARIVHPPNEGDDPQSGAPPSGSARRPPWAARPFGRSLKISGVMVVLTEGADRHSIMTSRPSEYPKAQPELLRLPPIRSQAQEQDADPPHRTGLLRADPTRPPPRRRAA
jgi:hypothetical protein